MQNRKLFLIIGILIILLFILILALAQLNQKTTSNTPTPTLSPFTSQAPIPTFIPDTRPVDLVKQIEEDNRTKHPEVFLANKMPYQTTNFSINFYYKESIQTFAFTVLSSEDQQQGKTDALAWIKSTGLTDAQIATLDIAYK